MTAADPRARDVCPRCSSDRIVPIDVADIEPEADELTADAPEPRPDPPNMRCESCGHRWWMAPRTPPINPGQEGVPT